MTYAILTHIKQHSPEFCESFTNIEDARDAFECYCLNGAQTEWEEGVELVQDYEGDEQDTIDYHDWD